MAKKEPTFVKDLPGSWEATIAVYPDQFGCECEVCEDNAEVEIVVTSGDPRAEDNSDHWHPNDVTPVFDKIEGWIKTDAGWARWPLFNEEEGWAHEALVEKVEKALAHNPHLFDDYDGD